MAEKQRQKGGQERGIGGSRREREREIASQLLPLFRCKLELIKILLAS